MRVTIAGMGNMGAAMAIRLATEGHDVVVWNRSPGRAGPAVEAGATEAGSLPEAVTGAEAVVTILANDDAVRSVVLGDGGLAGLLDDRAVYIDASTVSPELGEELSEAVPSYVAMPVLGSPEALRAGQAALLLGGADASMGMARRVAEAVAGNGRVSVVGTAPMALAAKLTSNYLLLAGLAVLAEALEVGRAGGLSDDTLVGLLKESPLVAPGLGNRFDAVVAGATDGWFSTVLGGKDVALGIELAARAGVRLEVGEAVRSLYRRAAEQGLAGADVAAVARVVRPEGRP